MSWVQVMALTFALTSAKLPTKSEATWSVASPHSPVPTMVAFCMTPQIGGVVAVHCTFLQSSRKDMSVLCDPVAVLQHLCVYVFVQFYDGYPGSKSGSKRAVVYRV